MIKNIIGKVNKTSKGLTNTFKIAKTPATTMAIKKPSTWAPGRIVAQINTASADRISLIRKLLIVNR